MFKACRGWSIKRRESITMTERMVINRAKKLQELEQQKADLEKQIDELKDQIKQDMEQNVIRRII